MKLLLFVQAIFTLFISGGLFFKENKLKNKALAVYFLLFSYEILNFIYGTTIIFTFYPEFHGRFYFSIGVLYGPLLWFHFKSITDNKDYIMSETLTNELVFVDELENGTEIEFDTIKSKILIEKM